MGDGKGNAGNRRRRAGAATSGRAGLVLLLAVLLALGVGFFVLLTRRGPERPQTPVAAAAGEGRSDPLAESPAGSRQLADPRAAAGDLGDTGDAEPLARSEPGVGDTPSRPLRDPTRFDGKGSLRGHVEVDGDEPFPASWRLVLGPSNVLAGREHAEERVLEFRAGEQDFEVEGLPLAGYDVRAEADGLNGRVQPVLLDRRSPAAFLNLQLVPAGFLEGFVYDDRAIPVEDVRVSLVAQADGARREARTDALGRYRFERVLDGSYELYVGHPDAPLLPGKLLRLQAPGMTFPTLTLTGTLPLEVFVIDAEDNPVEGALVRGSGSNGGWIDAVTDASGRWVEPHVLPGRFRLRVEHPDGPEHGSERRSFDLVPPLRPDGRREEVFRLRP